MNRVKLLSEQVANQIAAGEVIERPVSVVKELVENAIDAQSTRITVEITGGGRTLIRVSDDGIGMSEGDALMSLERHATSKIQKTEDLAKISTMGFRGEAIPSIASVSRMTILTRERGDDVLEGCEISISGGKILSVKAAGAPAGTTIEVRNLFFNLPARRKFLKSEETERGHIQHYITLVAMAYPGLALTYIQDGKTIFQFPAGKADELESMRMKLLKERMRLLYGTGDDLIEVNNSIQYDSTPDEDISAGLPAQMVPLKLWGLIGAPGVSRSSRDRQHLFVNMRPVDNKGLNYALLDAYQNALMKGRYPVCCLFLVLDPSEVDVNIHPAKREVKFHKEAAIRRIVSRILRTALEDYSDPFKCNERKELLDENKPEQNTVQPPLDLPSKPEMKPVETNAPKVFEYRPYTQPLPFSPVRAKNDPIQTDRKTVYPRQYHVSSQAPEVECAEIRPEPEPLTNAPLLTVPLRFLGVLNKLYLLFESDRGLVLVDQHAAHERVLFERLMSQAEQGKAESQQLLLSETVELGMRDASLIREKLPVFHRLGIGLHEFGERTFLIDSLPSFIKGISAKKFILDLLDDLRAAGRELTQADMAEELIASHSCRLAVKANDIVNREEIDHLMDDLRHCRMPYTCPHGRPTIIEISQRDLEKKFRRVL
ncbi:MAG: DNA mismatch repair endonuclease MutL [Verrucomicrobia bacterium]|nr:DNA mismatch repair endonuclease MutL [Verrucomicrobiota bacterium]